MRAPIQDAGTPSRHQKFMGAGRESSGLRLSGISATIRSFRDCVRELLILLVIPAQAGIQ